MPPLRGFFPPHAIPPHAIPPLKSRPMPILIRCILCEVEALAGPFDALAGGSVT